MRRGISHFIKRILHVPSRYCAASLFVKCIRARGSPLATVLSIFVRKRQVKIRKYQHTYVHLPCRLIRLIKCAPTGHGLFITGRETQSELQKEPPLVSYVHSQAVLSISLPGNQNISPFLQQGDL